MTKSRAAVVVSAIVLVVGAVVALRDCGRTVAPGATADVQAPHSAPLPSRGKTIAASDASGRPVASTAPRVVAPARGDASADSRTAEVNVVDSTTGLPIVGARVVADPRGDRRLAAVTGEDGRCLLEGIGAGECVFEVGAARRRTVYAMWNGGVVRVALDTQAGSCNVAVKVVGPGGAPFAGMRVHEGWTDQVAKTDFAGRVEFRDVAPGDASFSLDLSDWRAAVAAGKWDDARALLLVEDELEDGKSYEFVLGMRPSGTATLDARLVSDDGAPIAGAELHVDFRGQMRDPVVTDATGRARFSSFWGGRYGAWTEVDGVHSAFWHFDDFRIADGEPATRTWTLGAQLVQGRVVAGPDRAAVADAEVEFDGPGDGVATTGADGVFRLPRARAGTYRVTAHQRNRAALPRIVTVPSDGEIVVELLEYGRIVVRFLASDRPQLRTAKARLVDPAADGDGKGRALRAGSGDDDFVDSRIVPGHYEVEVAVGARSKRFPVEVKSGGTTVVEVTAP